MQSICVKSSIAYTFWIKDLGNLVKAIYTILEQLGALNVCALLHGKQILSTQQLDYMWIL